MPSTNTIENTVKKKAEINLEDGIIVFKNFGEYISTINSVYKLDDPYAWTKSIVGFEPYSDIEHEAIEALGKISTMEQLNDVMNKYRDVLTVRNQNNENHYNLIVPGNASTLFANKDGLYIIGDKAYRILGEYKLSIGRNMIDKLLTTHYSDIIRKNIDTDIEVKKYYNIVETNDINIERSQILPVEGEDPGIPVPDVIDSINNSDDGTTSIDYKHDTIVQNQTADRLVKLSVHATWEAYPNLNYVMYYGVIHLRAEKRIWLIGWVGYNTDFFIKGINNNGPDFVVNSPWGVYSLEMPYKVFENRSDFTLPLPEYGFNQAWEGYPGPENYLLSVHLKAWTGGTTENYSAIIDHDYNY